MALIPQSFGLTLSGTPGINSTPVCHTDIWVWKCDAWSKSLKRISINYWVSRPRMISYSLDCTGKVSAADSLLVHSQLHTLRIRGRTTPYPNSESYKKEKHNVCACHCHVTQENSFKNARVEQCGTYFHILYIRILNHETTQRWSEQQASSKPLLAGLRKKT